MPPETFKSETFPLEKAAADPKPSPSSPRAASETFPLEASDGRRIHVVRWLPGGGARPRGVVHIAHGMAEHGGRYARAAGALTAAGWAVYAHDHRGHGKTARWESELGYFDGGFRRTVRDLAELLEREKREHPGLPLVLFGHSMGSAMAQAYLADHGDAVHAGPSVDVGRDSAFVSPSVQAAIFSGPSGKPSALASAGRGVARLERLRVGERGRSRLLTELSFGGFNKRFKPNRTAFDWLSRDEAEVDRYIADPRCGFTCTASLWVELLDAMSEVSRPDRQARIPKDLPIYVFAGTRDPVGEDGKGVEQLVGAYRAAGLGRVTLRLYEGGRHEMLNETNRDEVTRDLLAWLEAEVPRG
jgi:alpha-beta hydrolase superfamily lysophospholipase